MGNETGLRLPAESIFPPPSLCDRGLITVRTHPLTNPLTYLLGHRTAASLVRACILGASRHNVHTILDCLTPSPFICKIMFCITQVGGYSTTLPILRGRHKWNTLCSPQNAISVAFCVSLAASENSWPMKPCSRNSCTKWTQSHPPLFGIFFVLRCCSCNCRCSTARMYRYAG